MPPPPAALSFALCSVVTGEQRKTGSGKYPISVGGKNKIKDGNSRRGILFTHQGGECEGNGIALVGKAAPRQRQRWLIVNYADYQQ